MSPSCRSPTTTNLPSVLVVRKDDAANSLSDLEGARYGYISKSCSSSCFSPAILLLQDDKALHDFFRIVPTAPWQGQIDAVVAAEVRATMVPEDIWKTTPANAANTKIIGRYDNATPALVVARRCSTPRSRGCRTGRACMALSGPSSGRMCIAFSTTSTSFRPASEPLASAGPKAH